MTHLVHLASGSPRRLQLLNGAGFDVVRIPSAPEPPLPAQGDGVEQALASASAKLPETGEGVLLSADTVVHLDGRCLGKPTNAEDAATMLRRLMGREHQVTTAVVLRCGDRVESFAVTSDVRFNALSDEAIRRYVASGEPMDKAGAYGIQGLGAVLVDSVRGSQSNVVGLPVPETVEALARFDVRPR